MQKTVIIALAVIGTLTAGFFLLNSRKTQTTPSELENIYNQWKLNYKINVGAAEDSYRFGVFSANYAKIQLHNSRMGRSYSKGLNAFTHLTPEEFGATHFGLKNVRLSTNANKTGVASSGAADWRKQMNDVKDQGQCGSCWAFSTVGAFEGLNHIVLGSELVSYSEQDLVDCSGDEGNQGCNGGLMDQGFQYIMKAGGLATEADYPYTAADGDCNNQVKRSGKISSFTDVTVNDPEALKAALDKQPVSVAIEADQDAFQSYSSGIINDDSCGTQLDHGVVAVGYNTKVSGEEVPYYIVRNSWGSSWGENGHVRIAITDGEGMCGIQMAASYPTA